MDMGSLFVLDELQLAWGPLLPSSVSTSDYRLPSRTFPATCGPLSPVGQSGNMCWAGFLSLGIPLLGGDRGLPSGDRREKGPP